MSVGGKIEAASYSYHLWGFDLSSAISMLTFLRWRLLERSHSFPLHSSCFVLCQRGDTVLQTPHFFHLLFSLSVWVLCLSSRGSQANWGKKWKHCYISMYDTTINVSTRVLEARTREELGLLWIFSWSPVVEDPVFFSEILWPWVPWCWKPIQISCYILRQGNWLEKA